MSEFENWFKTTSAYRMLESMNYYKMDLFHWVEARDEYRHTSVQIAFMTWVEQQAKIDELKKPRSLDEMAINQLAQANQVWRTKCDDLENRIHDAELQIAVHRGADEDTDSVLRDVENALRGEHENSN